MKCIKKNVKNFVTLLTSYFIFNGDIIQIFHPLFIELSKKKKIV